MNAKEDYYDLKALQSMRGYQKLQALWAHEYIKIMEAVQRAGAKGQESAWRYYAGQLKGADVMTQQLERALLQIEKEGEVMSETPASRDVEELFKKIKEESNQGENT